MSIHLSGDVGAVTAAVEAGASAAQQVGNLVARHVIPSPDEALLARFHLSSDNSQGEGPVHLDAMSVVQLRRLARKASGLSIQGREISRANRGQLIRALEEADYGSSAEQSQGGN